MKKTLFTLLSLSALFLSACKSDLEPQPSFSIVKLLSTEGTIGLTNTSTMSESAEVTWGDDTPNILIGGSQDTKFHTYAKNGTYKVTLKAKNGKKTSSISEVVNITNVSGSYGLYTKLVVGYGTAVGIAIFCQITGNGVSKYFYIKNGVGSSPTSCSGISDENIWSLPEGNYVVSCENPKRDYRWQFNITVESGQCKIGQLAN